ncbi:hypothetical protein D6C83_02141 [Aureobasidium pullulans]|uniref:Uncharacterized protein n=1 Tax=Aureobasidium pullulans TaxID=5580 RepID=A0A4V4JBS0_AURPU|nr:hypothetical protein D6D08_09640 [Aureobasidium pullulans]TIA67002.1 hypothetical protein D6C83_02141 [Aureobasidium pullulans]
MTSFYASSPTVVLPAPSSQYFPHSQTYQPPTSIPNAFFKQTTLPTPSTSSTAGRKRSRDDDDDEEVNLVAPLPSPPMNRGEPIYGPGMTLNNLHGQSSTGTWVENTWVETPQIDPIATQASRPTMPSRKSQRRAPSGPDSDEIALMTEPSAHRRTASVEPLIDEVTRLLGISWMRLDASEALQISAKAYTRWVCRHYPGLADIELWFENSSIPGYLGVATNRASGQKVFLLWSNDLKQAVLVTRDPTELISKLMSPQTIISSATESMFATDEPVADDSSDKGSPSPTFAIPSIVPQAAAAMDVD